MSRIKSSFDFSEIKVVIFDFDGVFTDNTVYVDENGKEAVRCSRLDGFGLRLLERASVEPIIVSTDQNPLVLKRAEKLKIKAFNGISDKRNFVQTLLDEMNLGFNNCVFVGNDLNDVFTMREAALGIAVKDSYPPVLEYADYVTKAQGGLGAVREVCELVYFNKVQVDDTYWSKDLITEVICKGKH